MTGVLEVALTALAAGCCPIRASTDGSKKPEGHSWKEWQQRRPDRSTLEWWFATGHPGLGLVTGTISGDLELFEFEGRAVAEGVLDGYVALVEAEGHGALWTRVLEGYSETTPSGGLHVLWRSPGEVGGPLKLAKRPPTEEEAAGTGDRALELIETKGQGGFCIVAPSNGKTHPTGGAWTLQAGGFATIATITGEERKVLLDLARRFDQPPPRAEATKERRTPPTARQPDGDSRPGDEFNERCEDVLARAGFQHHSVVPGGHQFTRPGKSPKHGSSAIVRYNHQRTGDERVALYSSSIDVPAEFLSPGPDGQERALTPWQAHAALHHGGDFSEAARRWRQDHPRPRQTRSDGGHTAPPLGVHDDPGPDAPPDSGPGRPAADPALVEAVHAELDISGPEAEVLALELGQKIQRTRLDRLARRTVDDRQAERDQNLDAIVAVRADVFVAQVDDPVRPLLGTLMAEGHNVVLTARYKVGKTKVIENAVAALITGTPFLDAFTVPEPRRVVLCNYEMTPADQRARLRRLGLDPLDLVDLHVVQLRGRRLVLTSPTGRDHLARILTEAAADVLIIDTLGAALSHCGLDENVNTDVRRFLSALDEVKLLAGTPSAIVTAHTGRAQHEEGAEHARGATVVDDWADVRLVLTKADDGSRFIYSEGRATDLPESRLRFDEDTGLLSMLHGDVGLSRRLNKADAVIEQIVSLVGNTPGMSKRELEDQLRAQGVDERGGRNVVREAIGLAGRRGHVHHHKGDRGAHLMHLGALHSTDERCPSQPAVDVDPTPAVTPPEPTLDLPVGDDDDL